MNTETNIDINSLLDGTLDDLADIPEFANYPVGGHKVQISWEGLDGKLKINNDPYIKINFKGIETVELADKENDKPISPGQESGILFAMKSEWGQGQFKNVLSELKKTFDGATNREVCEKSNGAECLIVTGLRENKKNKGQFFMSLENIKVL